MKYYMAFDLGGTNVKYALVNSEAVIIAKGKRPTPKSGLEELMDIIGEVTKKFEKMYHIEGIAMSCPGAVDDARGIIEGASAIPYIHGPNIRQLIENRTGYRVTMENDANCAALAEVWRGVAKEAKDVLFVVCGTGIGGAVIKDRKLHIGKHLFGGEFGFMIMEKDFEKGIYKNWSETASTYALVKTAARLKGISPEELNGEMIFKLAEEHKDEGCIKAIELFFHYLAMGIYNLQYIYDPEMIVIGGAISEREDLVDRINEKLDAMISNIPIARIYPKVGKCAFSNDANILGAVYNFTNLF